jgi:hypothetical protein
MFVQTDMQRNNLTDTGTVDIQKGIVTFRQRDILSSIDDGRRWRSDKQSDVQVTERQRHMQTDKQAATGI